MCEADQPEPPIDELRPNAEESPEETIEQLAIEIETFADWAGFDDYHKKAARLLLAGFMVKDLKEACELVGCTKEFAMPIIKRIQDNQLGEDRETWIDKDMGNMAFLLDVMVATGILKRKSENQEMYYSEADPVALTIGVHVKHKSGFGSGWWVAAHKTNENGQQFVRLKKSQTTPGPGGKWRAADNYVRSKVIDSRRHADLGA